MKAITCERYGPPEVLRVTEVREPVPKPDELLIRVRAVEATKSDCELRSFRHPVSWYWLPLRLAMGIRRPRWRVLGRYFAGEVVSKGSAVDSWRVGDAVFGAGRMFGAYAELLTAPASAPLAAKPGNMSFEEAAAVPLGAFNALHFLTRAHIRPGERVLINGAGGSIGAHGIQIARAFGAEVTAVDATHKAQMLQRLGAAAFIDYTTTDFTTTGERWDVILDMVAGSDYGACIRALNPGGRYLKAVPRLSDLIRSVFTTRFTDRRTIVAFAPETAAALERIRQMIEAGQIRPIVDRVYSMEEAATAHHRVESESRLGAVVIRIDDAH
ncbi:MAG: NAD(P)-dependent alcohol dehydrogenase [Pseudomonadales bacterium]